ncbi:hypothetical protein [Haloferula sp. BvORR071]|uniref:hypothetical protein n=1 Tax=Haloferula sp. BvORR071 TaxID=1396141 RepID=UPI00055733D2|nr:hypothetical protein [Haloferula sp. BvORR071]
MNKLLGLILLAATAIATATAAEPLVSLDYEHSRRIPNQVVKIQIDDSGALALETKAADQKSPRASKLQITPAQLAALKKELPGVDWAKAKADQVSGKDGTKVTLTYATKTVSLWSPDYDTGKRGLESVQKLLAQIFSLAGLEPSGMPAKAGKK